MSNYFDKFYYKEPLVEVKIIIIVIDIITDNPLMTVLTGPIILIYSPLWVSSVPHIRVGGLVLTNTHWVLAVDGLVLGTITHWVPNENQPPRAGNKIHLFSNPLIACKVLPSCADWGIDRRCGFGALEHVCLLVSPTKAGRGRRRRRRRGGDACIVLSLIPPQARAAVGTVPVGLSAFILGAGRRGRSIRRRQIHAIEQSSSFEAI